jgi:predicted transcriptional regulator
MTPPEPQPPSYVGTQPRNADEVNGLVGLHLRNFIACMNAVGQDHDFFLTVDLKAPPYYFEAEQETLIKSAIADLDASLDMVDMTFISQLVGMG